jgi:hypothetical protein
MRRRFGRLCTLAAGALLAGFGLDTKVNGSRRNGGRWIVYRETNSLACLLILLGGLVHSPQSLLFRFFLPW